MDSQAELEARLNELIRVGIKDDPESFKKVPRVRLKLDNINRVFKVNTVSFRWERYSQENYL